MEDRAEYIPKAKVDKSRLRKEILVAMVECAKNIRGYYGGAAGIIIDDTYLLPEEFKPGVADKLLFCMIIEDNWQRILDIHCCAPLCGRMIGFGLMIDTFFPMYGTYRKMTAEEEKMRDAVDFDNY